MSLPRFLLIARTPDGRRGESLGFLTEGDALDAFADLNAAGFDLAAVRLPGARHDGEGECRACGVGLASPCECGMCDDAACWCRRVAPGDHAARIREIVATLGAAPAFGGGAS